MKKITVLLFSLFCVSGYAQNTAGISANHQRLDQQWDSLKRIKNEIAVNVQPLIFLAMSGTGHESKSHWEIDYKLRYKWSGFIIGMTYRKNEAFWPYADDFAQSYGLPVSFSDRPPFPSSTTYSINNKTVTYLYAYLAYHTKQLQAIGGYEIILGKRKLKHVIGFRIYKTSILIEESTSRFYETTDSMSWGSISRIDSGKYIGSRSSYIRKTSLLPFYGIEYEFSSHFGISANLGYEGYWLRGNIDYAGENGETYSERTKQRGTRYSHGIVTNPFEFLYINNISLVYRF